jgi:LmbE family N-acetylglucosaminyl deacetylase
MFKKDMLESSIIVSAHPDDEILWFSSIVDKVDAVIVCFLGSGSHPDWSEARKQSLSEHPIQDIICLGMDQAEIFKGSDWQNPAITEYGLAITNNNISDRIYNEIYHRLKKLLAAKLSGYKNVVTHNPWGEYGHEEHVQLYRVVRELQDSMGFHLWFSNYCSSSSANFMMRYISGFDAEYLTLQTNKTLGKQAMDIYKKNNCWTWYDDWEWFNEESFMKDRDVDGEVKKYGHIFPANIIKFSHYPEGERAKEEHKIAHAWRTVKSSMKKIMGHGQKIT